MSVVLANGHVLIPHLPDWSGIWNGASSSFRKDGAVAASGNPGTQTADGVLLFQRGGASPSRFVSGYMSDWMFVSGAVGATDLYTLEGLLGAKYGITIS